jgi:hypothetical protein
MTYNISDRSAVDKFSGDSGEPSHRRVGGIDIDRDSIRTAALTKDALCKGDSKCILVACCCYPF